MLIENIEKEFKNIQRPEVSLRQFYLTDQKGMSGEITDEEWYAAGRNRIDSQWKQIPEEEIKECGCVLAHMDAEEFQYYLPAYLRYACNNISRNLLKNDITGMVVSSLYPSQNSTDLFHYKIQQLSLLTTAQKRTIIEFLEFISSEADDFTKQDAQIALNRFWYKNTLNKPI